MKVTLKRGDRERKREREREREDLGVVMKINGEMDKERNKKEKELIWNPR